MLSRHPFVFAISSILLVTVAVQSALGDSLYKSDDQPEGSIIISQYASDIILDKGGNYTFYCKSNRSINFTQQSLPEENLGPFKTKLEQLDSDDQDYDYSVAYHLYNIDEFAVGYYACFDDTIDSETVLKSILEEPTNTEHIIYTYVYVDGTENLFAPINDVVMVKASSEFIIGCRTNMPEVNVTLLSKKKPLKLKHEEDIEFSPKIGFTVRTRKPLSTISCEALLGNRNETKDIRSLSHPSTEPRPQVFSEHVDFLGGESFSLNCTIDYRSNLAIMLTWITPNDWKRNMGAEHEMNKQIITNEHSVVSGKLYKTLIVNNAGPKDAGVYTCVSTTTFGDQTANVTKNYLEHGYVEMIRGTQKNPIEAKGLRSITLHATIHAYPPPNITVFKDSKEIVLEYSKKYKKSENMRKGTFSLKIGALSVNDTGNYTVVATNEGATATENFDLRIQAPPNIDLGSPSEQYALLNTTTSFRCDVVGYPLPTVMWSFKNNQDGSVSETRGKETIKSIYMITSILEMPAMYAGEVTCTASNALNTKTETRQLRVYEIMGGFGIINGEDTWLAESQHASFKCYASKYNYENVTWFHDTYDLSDYVSYSDTNLSTVAVLNFDSVRLSQAGKYTCTAFESSELGEYIGETNQTIELTVTAISDPVVLEPKVDGDLEVYPYQPVSLTCLADAIPKPEIQWYKDGVILNSDDKIDIFTNYLNHSTVNSTISIVQSLDENKGKYECVVTNNLKSSNRFINLVIKEKSSFKAEYLGIIGLIFLLLLLVVIYLILRVRKEKAFRKELAAAGLLNFKEGATASINPELGIDDQAELLPYDEKFEFSPEKLKLEKQLGAGAFGVVYKGIARGILNAEETTIVAVKMVKKTADNMYIKALASELKIMVHLGKHINIVNLLGACTKNVGKRELLVIVEYCKYGNIHNYLQRHREVFINQLTEVKDKGVGRVNRGFSSSSNNSGTHSDYFGSNHTQDTDNTCLNSINTNRSGRKVSESSYLPPEWRSNYESDYSYDSRSPRPLCSRDLLCWAFQIARGMEYLANRKVLHGDLAARNILLAEDNVVKICDFGLAKSIYKNDEYQKKENSPLPVKWLALECMTDRIFSTQSDVWSFGIVLWEIFSLAKTPYPGLSPQSLLPWLSDGKRLEKPPYADERLYEVMLHCWNHKPTSRPTFTQLQETLGSFLDEHVKNYYIDLNATYMDVNAKRDVEDYLDMMCAPDYNNLVTPNPHHYINDPTMNFFPPPSTLQHDEDGYLQMSPSNQPFNPRPHGPKFDYDVRKLNARSATPEKYQHELTPMLTLNNLPARSGSDSDHEGSTSPYLNMCPRIEEETDEVFENNSKNNEKNLSHIKAITNPTYITFDLDLDKKQASKYMNVGPNNSLVK